MEYSIRDLVEIPLQTFSSVPLFVLPSDIVLRVSWVVEKGNLNCIFVTPRRSFDLHFKHYIEFGECVFNHSSAIVPWIKRAGSLIFDNKEVV